MRCEKTLIVRSDPAKDGTEIGRLLPGQVVTILEERMTELGDVWGCVALDSIGTTLDKIATHPEAV